MARRYALSTWICILTLMLLCVCAGAESVEAEQAISQAAVNMPEVTVYVRNPAGELRQAEAYLGSRELKLQSMGDAKDEGIHYLVLLDISASISKRTFERVKAGLIEFAAGLEPMDRLSLYTFGDEVTEIPVELSRQEELGARIQEIRNQDQNTLLYEAVDLAAKQAVNQRTHGRTVLLVITDGEDFALGKTTRSETMKTLEETGIPLYAYTVEASRKEYIDGMGEVARNSGGDIVIAQNGKEAEAFDEIRGKAEDVAVLRYEAESNRVSRERENIVIKLPGAGGTLVRSVMVVDWTPDTQAPEMRKAERAGECTLRIELSERVVGAGLAQAWRVQRDGEEIPVVAAAYTETEDGITVELRTGEELYRGRYTITASGVTDDSQEENALDNAFTGVIDGPQMPVEPEEGEAEPEDAGLNVVVWRIVGGIVLLGVIACVCIVAATRRKGGEQAPERRDVYVDGQSIRVSEEVRHEKISIEQQPGMPLTIYVDTDGKNMIKIDGRIDRSLFIGRSKINNYYFNDAMLSGQHFALEYEGGRMFISDLDSANGTKVNGIAIRKRHILCSGDVVEAGMLRFRFVWQQG